MLTAAPFVSQAAKENADSRVRAGIHFRFACDAGLELGKRIGTWTVDNHLKALNTFYGKLAQTSAAMEGSVDDAKKAQEQIGLLATNLGRLNSVYGNMLSAMQGR